MKAKLEMLLGILGRVSAHIGRRLTDADSASTKEFEGVRDELRSCVNLVTYEDGRLNSEERSRLDGLVSSYCKAMWSVGRSEVITGSESKTTTFRRRDAEIAKLAITELIASGLKRGPQKIRLVKDPEGEE